MDTPIDYKVKCEKTTVLHVLTLLFSLKLIVSFYYGMMSIWQENKMFV